MLVKEVSRETEKYFELNENKNITYQDEQTGANTLHTFQKKKDLKPITKTCVQKMKEGNLGQKQAEDKTL